MTGKSDVKINGKVSELVDDNAIIIYLTLSMFMYD